MPPIGGHGRAAEGQGSASGQQVRPGMPWCIVRLTADNLPSLLGGPHEHCKVAEDFEISHGISFAAN